MDLATRAKYAAHALWSRVRMAGHELSSGGLVGAATVLFGSEPNGGVVDGSGSTFGRSRYDFDDEPVADAFEMRHHTSSSHRYDDDGDYGGRGPHPRGAADDIDDEML